MDRVLKEIDTLMVIYIFVGSESEKIKV